jgi:hypothetical protein
MEQTSCVQTSTSRYLTISYYGRVADNVLAALTFSVFIVVVLSLISHVTLFPAHIMSSPDVCRVRKGVTSATNHPRRTAENYQDLGDTGGC